MSELTSCRGCPSFTLSAWSVPMPCSFFSNCPISLASPLVVFRFCPSVYISGPLLLCYTLRATNFLYLAFRLHIQQRTYGGKDHSYITVLSLSQTLGLRGFGSNKDAPPLPVILWACPANEYCQRFLGPREQEKGCLIVPPPGMKVEFSCR